MGESVKNCEIVKCDVYNEKNEGGKIIESDSENTCCYNLRKKLREFLQTDNYMLDYKNLVKKEENVDRLKVFYSKFFQPYSVLPNKKICSEFNDKYFNIFGIIPLELIPASYIPFNYKNYEMNLDRLKKGEIFFEDDYKKIFVDFNKQPDPLDTTYISERYLKEYLEFCLKDKLNNPKSIFNAYSTYTMTIIVCILWFFILIPMLYVLFYYYRDIYSYILLFTTILLVLIAIVWKMIYILNID